MSRLARFCPHCGRLVPPGKACACRPRAPRKPGKPRKRKPAAGDARRAEREPWRRQYATKEFQEARQAVISLQKGRCRDCGRVCAWHDGSRWRTAGMGGEVDHEVPLCQGGGNGAGNLALRCKSCHGKADAARRKIARGERP